MRVDHIWHQCTSTLYIQELPNYYSLPVKFIPVKVENIGVLRKEMGHYFESFCSYSFLPSFPLPWKQTHHLQLCTKLQTLIPIFEGENFQYWNIEMRTLFISQDLWDIVEDGYEAPSNEEDLATWQEARRKKYKENNKRDANALLNL